MSSGDGASGSPNKEQQQTAPENLDSSSTSEFLYTYDQLKKVIHTRIGQFNLAHNDLSLQMAEKKKWPKLRYYARRLNAEWALLERLVNDNGSIVTPSDESPPWKEEWEAAQHTYSQISFELEQKEGLPEPSDLELKRSLFREYRVYDCL